jgi:hypothetical protein
MCLVCHCLIGPVVYTTCAILRILLRERRREAGKEGGREGGREGRRGRESERERERSFMRDLTVAEAPFFPPSILYTFAPTAPRSC